MGWNVTILEGERIVYGVATGNITVGLVRKMASEGLDVAARHQASRFLFDMRVATSCVSTVEIYQLPRVLEALGLRRDSRAAILVSEGTEQDEDCCFYRTVAENQGFTVGLFHEPCSAHKWLEEGE